MSSRSSEARGISLAGLGWPYAPGIWSAEQAEAWEKIVGPFIGRMNIWFVSCGIWAGRSIPIRTCRAVVSRFPLQ